MIVLKKEEKATYIEMHVEANHADALYKNKIITVDGERFLIKQAEEIKIFNERTNYLLYLKHLPRKTIHDYSTTDFMHVSKIERTDSNEVQIISNGIKTIVTFKNPSDCLKEFLELKKLRKEALSNEGK